MSEHTKIARIVITAEDGERVVEFSPGRTYAEIAEPELGAVIADAMHMPVGYTVTHQLVSTVKHNVVEGFDDNGVFFTDTVYVSVRKRS